MPTKTPLRNLLETVSIVTLGIAIGLGGISAYQSLTRPSPLKHGNYSSLLSAQKAELVLFSSTTCPFCSKAKAYLNTHGVSYRVLEINQSKEAMIWFQKLEASGVPTLVKKDQALVGFDEAAFAAFIGN